MTDPPPHHPVRFDYSTDRWTEPPAVFWTTSRQNLALSVFSAAGKLSCFSLKRRLQCLTRLCRLLIDFHCQNRAVCPHSSSVFYWLDVRRCWRVQKHLHTVRRYLPRRTDARWEFIFVMIKAKTRRRETGFTMPTCLKHNLHLSQLSRMIK